MRSLQRFSVVSLFVLAALSFTGCFTEDDSSPDSGTADGGGDGGDTDGGSDGGPTCDSGDVQTCACAGQADGLQACLPSGDWGTCNCSADCPTGEHDGGDGTCVPDGTCSATFHDGGDGTCVPDGSCLTGFHDGGDGSCVPDGLCQAGFHDGGDGSCVAEGVCSAGYRPSSTGACILLQPCSAGLTVSPTSLQFGDLPVGQTLMSTVSFTNPAPFDPCPISSIDLASGTSADFSLVGGALSNIELAPGASLTVDVEFSPSVAGSASGFLTALDSSGVSTVRLLGNGLDVSAFVTPTSYDFGSVAYPCGQGSTPVCVTNDGGIDLMVTSVGTGGSDFTLAPTGPAIPASLPVGVTLCWSAEYVPGSVGATSGSVQVDVAPGGFSFTVPLTGAGAAQGSATDTYLQTASAKADILWVMDDSCSMSAAQASLSSNAGQLITYLDQQGVDYQMAVVSTDATTTGNPANIPGMIEPQDRSRDHIVTPALTDPSSAFAQNILLGTQGSATETGFEVARLALTSPMADDPAQNGGFIRSDAYLSIIFVSDEPEQSPDTEANYLSFFEGIHGAARPDLFIASAFVGPPPTGCNDQGIGQAAAALRYWNMAGTTGGAQSPFCSPDWSAAMQAIAASFDLVSRFPLTEAADASGTTSVWIIDGSGNRTPATGWTYDAGSNAIDFNAANVPQPGETIEVTYTTICI